MRAIRALRYNLEHGGVGVVLRKVAGRLVALFYRAEAWLLFEMDLESPAAPELAPGTELRTMTMEDLLLHHFFKAVHYPDDLRARFADGDLCLGIFMDGSLAHVAWMASHRLPLDPGLPVFAAAGAAGIYDMFTLPGFRRRGCQALALREILRRAEARGLTRAVAVVHPANRPSISAFEKCGFRAPRRLEYRRTLWRSHLTLVPLDA
ncbi:MAG: GNAT family N-acetyltransferase [Gemmatimonadota bacterium]